MVKLRKKKIIIIITVILIGVISVGVVKATNKEDKDIIKVNQIQLKEEEIQSNIITSGIIKSKKQINVVSDLPYIITDVLVEEGDKVKKGQALIKIDTKELEYDVKKAQIGLELEKNNLNTLLKDVDSHELENKVKNIQIIFNEYRNKYERSRELYKNGALSKSEFISDENNYKKAKNDLELAKKNLNDYLKKDSKKKNEVVAQKKTIELKEITLQEKREEIQRCIVKSPIEGTIVFSNAKIGIPAHAKDPLFIIDKIDDLEIEANISEYDIGDVKIGQEVEIEGEAFSGEKFKGQISFIAPTAVVENTNSGVETNVKIKVDILNSSKKLKPGFSSDITISTASKKDALVLPYECLYRKKDDSVVVFKIENARLKEIPVKIGIEGDLNTEIISNKLKEGDKIVQNPSSRLKDGQKIEIVNKGDKK